MEPEGSLQCLQQLPLDYIPTRTIKARILVHYGPLLQS